MRGSRRLLAAPACAWLVLALAAALAAPGIALARPAGAPGQAPPVRHAPPERPAAPVNDSYEPNDTAAQAAPLPLGVEIESWLSFLGDEDYYKFDLAEIQQITVTLRSLPTDYDVWLYWEDPADHLLYYFGDDWGSQNPETADEQIQVTPPHPGTFYVYVYGWLFDYNPDDSYLLKATAGGGGAGQPPAVTVSVPNGGESWEAGSQHAITWTATDPDTP
ncbi:MAG: PPC domain-containing protein, partial [Candidatus Eisenbacteria bacterium]